MSLTERESKVAEKKLAEPTKEKTPEKEEVKVEEVSTNADIEAVAPNTCGAEDAKPTEIETKLVPKKQHRQMKKATRRRDENLPNLTKEEAAFEEEEKKDVESQTKENSVGMVEAPAEEITFDPEDPIQAEKELEVTVKKVASQTREPTLKKEENKVAQDPTTKQPFPEGSKPIAEKTEVTDIEIKDTPAQEQRNVAIKTSAEIVEHGQKEDFSNSINDELNLPKKDETMKKSRATQEFKKIWPMR